MPDILTYLELPHACSFRIVYQDDSDYAGTYSNQILKNQITLSICTKQNPMSILAALCHECTHFFMHYHGLNVSNTQVNEKRTDACAVIIGFAYILYQGYQLYANRRIGYLSPETCLKIHKFTLYKSKCVDNHNKLRKNIAVAKTLYEQAESLYNTIDISQIKKYTFCVAKAITYFEKADFAQIISSCEKVDASNVNQLINANERINNICADMADCIYLFQNLYNGKVCKKRQHNVPRTKHTCSAPKKTSDDKVETICRNHSCNNSYFRVYRCLHNVI